MRHQNRRTKSEKQNVLNMFNSQRKAKVKSCSTVISAPCHSSVCTNNKTGHCSVHQKTKHLKTIKQRNQIRRQSTNRSNQSHQHCERESKDKAPCIKYQDCQCSHSLSFCRQEKPVAKPFPSQKPSIITEGRLTSIRGLFSHKVRSVDIERLVKEKKYQMCIENQEGQATARNSPSPSGLIPHSTPPAVISETSEEGLPACANKDLKSKMSEKTDCLQTNLEATLPGILHRGNGKHNSAQTHKATDNTARPGRPSDQKGINEAVILSSSESEPVHKVCLTSVKVSPSNHNVSPKKKNTYDQKQANKATAAMDVQHNSVNIERFDTPAGSEIFNLDAPQFEQHDSVNIERLDTPAGSEVFNLDAPQFDASPVIFMFSSPTLNKERNALGNESQHRKPGFSSKEEAVSRLAARLCHKLGPVPLRRCHPLLTECRKVLLHHLQDRHGSQLQHNLHRLHSQLSEERPHSPHTAEQVWPSSVQKYLDNTQIYFSYTRTHEADQQRETGMSP